MNLDENYSDTNTNHLNRRRDVRLAGGPTVDAVIVDDHQYPVEVLRQSQVLNVSAGGLALISKRPANPGTQVNIVYGDTHSSLSSPEQLRLEVLDCSSWLDNQYRVRCKRVAGLIPAELIYGW